MGTPRAPVRRLGSPFRLRNGAPRVPPPLHLAAALVLLVSTVACGGPEERPPPAPLPAAWIAQDEGRASVRPEPRVLGEPAERRATSGGEAEASPRGDRATERAAFQALVDDFGRVWNTTPATARASGGCAATGRWAQLAIRWIQTAEDVRPDRTDAIGRAAEPLEIALEELEAECRADEDWGGLAGREGRIQGVGEAIDDLDRQLQGILR